MTRGRVFNLGFHTLHKNGPFVPPIKPVCESVAQRIMSAMIIGYKIRFQQAPCLNEHVGYSRSKSRGRRAFRWQVGYWYAGYFGTVLRCGVDILGCRLWDSGDGICMVVKVETGDMFGCRSTLGRQDERHAFYERDMGAL